MSRKMFINTRNTSNVSPTKSKHDKKVMDYVSFFDFIKIGQHKTYEFDGVFGHFSFLEFMLIDSMIISLQRFFLS